MSDNKHYDDEQDVRDELEQEGLETEVDEVDEQDLQAHEQAHEGETKEERKARAREEYRRREMERQRSVLLTREKQEARAAKDGTPVKHHHEKKRTQAPNFFVRLGKKIRDTFGELKHVTWPPAKTVVRSTTVVLVVTAAFLVVTMLMDSGLGAVYQWFTGRL